VAAQGILEPLEHLGKVTRGEITQIELEAAAAVEQAK
jgi:hypothetical protein